MLCATREQLSETIVDMMTVPFLHVFFDAV